MRVVHTNNISDDDDYNDDNNRTELSALLGMTGY